MRAAIKRSRFAIAAGIALGFVIWAYDYDFFLNAGGPETPISRAILRVCHLQDTGNGDLAALLQTCGRTPRGHHVWTVTADGPVACASCAARPPRLSSGNSSRNRCGRHGVDASDDRQTIFQRKLGSGEPKFRELEPH